MPAATREAQDSGLGKIEPNTMLIMKPKNVQLIIKGFVHNRILICEQIIDFIFGFLCVRLKNQFILNHVKGYTFTSTHIKKKK